MSKAIMLCVGIIIGLAAGWLLHGQPTIYRDKIVHPNFTFEVGEQAYCTVGTTYKPCKILARQSDGSYLVTYTIDGLGGGKKIESFTASELSRP